MPDDRKQRTFVTGATGFLGNNLVRELLRRDRPVRALIYGAERSLEGLSLERVDGDICDPACLRLALRGIDVVYHLAAAISIDKDSQPSSMQRVNGEGTSNVVRACLEAGVRRLVHVSSIHAISWFPRDEPIDETRSLALDSSRHLPYDYSKACGQQHVLNGVREGLDAVILNPVGMFGINDFEPSPGGEMLLQLVRRKLPALLAGGYYWVDVRDVVHAALNAEERGRRGDHYILAAEYATFRKIATWVQQTTGISAPRLTLPIGLVRGIAPWLATFHRWKGQRPLITPETLQIVTCHQQIETCKARREIGFSPRPLSETVQDSIQWMLNHAIG